MDTAALEFSAVVGWDLFACRPRLPFRPDNLEKIEGVSAPTKAELPSSFRNPKRFA